MRNTMAALPGPAGIILSGIFLAGIILAGCRAPSGGAADGAEENAASIRALLKDQESAWNEGDIRGFMEGYLASESLRFASGGDVTYGWEAALERYERGYPDREAMGRLRFSDIAITLITGDAALVFGRWSLERAKDQPSGLFTLFLRKTGDGWRVVHDHTSSAEE